MEQLVRRNTAARNRTAELTPKWNSVSDLRRDREKLGKYRLGSPSERR